MRRSVVAAIDTGAVVVFSLFGRGAHSEGVGPSQLWSTAWPFLAGLLVGWGVLLGSRVEPLSVRAGVTVWASTSAVGLLIWAVRRGEPPHWSFVVVAGTVTAVLLLGWRALARRTGERSR